jgi:tetratricopeptide (TPR) repeat protein
VYRQERAPPEDHWWWYLDQQVAQARARKRVRLAQSSLVGAGIVAVLALAYILFLRPDQAVRLRYGYQLDAELQVEQGNYDRALELYQEALALAPREADLNLATGVLYEALGQPQNAQQQYATAEAAYGTPAEFLTARAQQFLRLGWFERAAEQALAAREADDRYALAHCVLGSAYQGLGDNSSAISALWVCADLASEHGQNELYVQAKTLLATLMQQPPDPDSSE